MDKKHPICALWFLLCMLCGAYGQDTGHLFITSTPFGARVTINGRILPEKTPLLLRNLEDGVYTVRIEREGYESTVQTLEIGDAPVIQHTATLVPLFVQIPLSGKAVSVNGQTAQDGTFGFMIPQGTWNISNESGRIMLDPVYPFHSQKIAAKSATLIFATLTLLSGAHDLLSPVEKSAFLSPFTFVCGASSIAAGSFWTGYALHQRTFTASVTSLPLNSYEDTYKGQALYNEAEARLTAGSIDEALDLYSRILHTYPYSAYLPGVLYKTARINEIKENNDVAATLYSLLITTYPVPDFYDKSCFALSLIQELNKEYTRSIQSLRKMVYADPGYSAEEISARIRILEELEAEL